MAWLQGRKERRRSAFGRPVNHGILRSDAGQHPSVFDARPAASARRVIDTSSAAGWAPSEIGGGWALVQAPSSRSERHSMRLLEGKNIDHARRRRRHCTGRLGDPRDPLAHRLNLRAALRFLFAKSDNIHDHVAGDLAIDRSEPRVNSVFRAGEGSWATWLITPRGLRRLRASARIRVSIC
jgi:hypothetical protein